MDSGPTGMLGLTAALVAGEGFEREIGAVQNLPRRMGVMIASGSIFKVTLATPSCVQIAIGCAHGVELCQQTAVSVNVQIPLFMELSKIITICPLGMSMFIYKVGSGKL